MNRVLVIFILIIIWANAAGAEVLQFTPTDDTYVRKNDPNENNGAKSFVRIRSTSQYAYLKFDVNDINETVIMARLRLHSESNPIDDTSVYAVGGNWDQNTITWGNDDLAWDELLETKENIAPDTWYEFDATGYVDANGAYTFGLKTTQAAGGLKYSSRESANKPELELTTGPLPPLPEKANAPSPVDEDVDVNTLPVLGWTAGIDAISHHVYFGTSFGAVNDANTSLPQFKGKYLTTNFEPWLLDPNSVYYWRIDERNVAGVTKGDIWSFETRLGEATIDQCDFTSDGYIDSKDLWHIADQWPEKFSHDNGWSNEADLNRSSRVNFVDLELFGNFWDREVPGYFVAVDGNDSNPGTKQAPFATIQRCADLMTAGETCYVRGGTYRQRVTLSVSGSEGSPISFKAYNDEKVCLDGRDFLDVNWVVHSGNIYKAATDADFEQLFLGDDMMVEARWPNMEFPGQLWDMSCWANSGVGSRYGKMVDPALSATGIDWTGAVAVLNVAHQFYTWTRDINSHSDGNDTFYYAKDLDGITSYATKTTPWENDKYFLKGKLEALDTSGEWFLDRDSNTLYLWTVAGDSPENYSVGIKQRNYGFEAAGGADHINISGIDMFACTFVFSDNDHCVVSDCNLLYPVFSRRLEEPNYSQDSVKTKMDGINNTVQGCSFGYASTEGLKMIGKKALVENNLIHDVSWYGSLKHVALSISSDGERWADEGCKARWNTLYNMGNAALNYRGYENLVEFNHVYNGGIACEDVALVYTGQPTTAGSIVRYNWVHGCRTQSGKGLGIRGDDQTRTLTVHHNVVWDCGRDGIIVKGDFNKVYNNTVFEIGTVGAPGNYINMHTAEEPYKWWRQQYPLLDEQNANSEIYNNAAFTITSNNNGDPFPDGNNIGNNFMELEMGLVDINNFAFAPDANSPLINGGRAIPGFTDGYLGASPDIGAYEHGGSYWVPGRK